MILTGLFLNALLMAISLLLSRYSPYTLLTINGYDNDSESFIYGEKLKSVFYPSNSMFENIVCERVFSPSPTKTYVTQKSYKYLMETYADNDCLKNVLPANVAYLFNYENSPNDNYYFIDNVDGGSLVRNAPTPEREGYIFDGWYKDTECLNAWNFDTDITPATLYDENGKEVYQEAELYAKWVAK